jgi:acetyl-CoA acetyltransferase
VPATRNALAKAGLSISDMDVIESNEAFAARPAPSRELGFDPAKVNPNGSGISLGHPIGATGAIIATKLVHELHRIGGRYGWPPCASAAVRASRWWSRRSEGEQRHEDRGAGQAGA